MAEVLAVDLQKASIEVPAARLQPALHRAGVKDEVGIWIAIDQLAMQQRAFAEDVIAGLTVLRHVDQIEKGVAAGVMGS